MTPNFYDPQLEVELRELRRLAKQRRRLELPAKIFLDKAPKSCHGDCESPQSIGTMGLTCCHFYQMHEHYDQTLRQEVLQRQAVEAGRAKHRKQPQAKIEGADLQNEYYRDFTGTAKNRKLKDDPEKKS